MRTLAEQFTKDGFEYQMIARDKYKAIFAQKMEGKDYAYEVIRIKIYPDRKCLGSIIEAGEYYPTANSWGTDGFTFKDYEEAIDKYSQLVEPKIQNRQF